MYNEITVIKTSWLSNLCSKLTAITLAKTFYVNLEYKIDKFAHV